MNDETKAALESWRREMADGDPDWWERERLILAHLDGESARLAAAREEQRAVDYGATLEAGHAFIRMMSPSEPFGAADFSRFESCAKFTRPPLTSTPLADRIAELEARAAEWADAQRVFLTAEAQVAAAREACARLVDRPWSRWAGDAGRDVLRAMDEAAKK